MHFQSKGGTLLERLLIARRVELSRLAEYWHTLGASAFGILEADEVVAEWAWPAPVVTERLVSRYTISYPGGALRLFVSSSSSSPEHQPRLETDAVLVRELLRLEYELSVMTDELVQKQDQMLALYDLTRALRSEVGVEGIMQIIVQEASRILQSGGSFCRLVSPDHLVQHPAGRLPAAHVRAWCEQVMTQRSRLLLEAGAAPDVEGLLSVPVWMEGEVRAILGVFDRADGFKSPDIRLLQAIAELVGSKLEHAMMYERTLAQERINTEMTLARQLQGLLLPDKQPSVPGLDIFAAMYPAFQVGGDFYDWLNTPDSFTFMVGDVAGKGVAAAMMMAMIRSALRSVARFGFALMTPEDILEQTCEDVYDDFTRVSTFTTVFVGQYDPRHGRLVYANAGQSPIMFGRPGEPARLLEADAPALGVLPNSLSRNASLPMQPGDVLVVATDGLPEAENAAEERFGYDRLLALVEQHRHLPAADIAAQLYAAVSAFEDNRRQHDDRTLLVIKCLPHRRAATVTEAAEPDDVEGMLLD
ncbi:MAG: SpoIIE family protein phosphatase [Anaerolineae bacterium]|jgi:sigma-B regulation protein RsbU (phosphoserine phosphatase)|nr:SpoIIE family protein phosphatase [Anaerolineae bacterium]